MDIGQKVEKYADFISPPGTLRSKFFIHRSFVEPHSCVTVDPVVNNVGKFLIYSELGII